ncbi:MAG: ABC transporter ATP-binding protein [Mesorhizobium sp.]|uniref:ABC transporter ATP-binding protein n=6 Tax=Mesorhizobium TaxID=68287 RepID=UPI000F763F23|nr:ABC transporter ATP-binding protein [Mesorhizobium sp. M1A.F.Ca.IN.022.06.1.1]RUV25369.1 ABC transporter ATP-binding protein [Mesorhizobium sp. M1A.F.Ca.IN.022.04.1.1]RUV56760.1 ABC transporter ATP-binding protein [Mesorhizobium sp. M1A.F.Ca.IN.022.02.1.1]RUV69341.1 ABC transporter ATP-binding protein [Mesorhizobium sp. M1A.F.Ca.IN.020.30.1.1]RWG30147.1 MAG: ABC transporter ATP-binding protein [Mesorhizobium sp.]TGQ22414.1 ABC transporter ATP-binding protein [Mesorhizobium sp. M00.F.Ca.ET.2
MMVFRIDLRASAFRSVLGFTLGHWRRQPWRLSLIMGAFLLSTLADVLTPLYSGRLVDAVASSAGADEVAWHAAMTAFSILMALALAAVVLRNAAFMGIVELTLKMMSDIAADAFHRVQRFSTDWHANSFAGSTVRKITRGMWALDLLNDTILIALLPSFVMLVGSTLLLGWFWPMMGLVVAIGSVLFIAVTGMLSLGYVAPAARLANSWDTRLGGALADAVSCNAVVKGFGAEAREEARLARVVAKWRLRTGRTWVRGTFNGTLRSQIAIVQQEPILFHRSLAENIAYARPGATQAEIEHAAKLASAHDFIADLPKGYGTLVGERGVKLSGGERQRVAIARAFLADARILILDEATSSLDSASEVLIQKAMERLMVGRTTLVIAHRLSTVRALDRLLVFDRGRIIEEGSHDELIRLNGGIYRRLFERQALELTKGLVA